jgi:single-strand DNA-binding protein
MNNLTVNGNLVKDMQVKAYGKGNILGSFTIANNERVGQEETTSFINCVVFGEKRIEALQKYLVKGCKVLVNGRLQVENYKDEEGNYKTFTSVVVNNLEIEKFMNDEEESKNNKYNKYNKRK